MRSSIETTVVSGERAGRVGWLAITEHYRYSASTGSWTSDKLVAATIASAVP